MVARNVKAVILDLDGTIVALTLDFMSARAEVIGFLETRGFPRSLFSLNESVFEMLKKAEVSMRNSGKTQKEFLRLKEAILEILEKYEAEGARSTTLVPGIRETLQTLKDMKLKLALFTVNGKKSTSYTLNAFNLTKFFDATVTRDSVPLVKPDPIHLETVLKALKVKPEEAIVVGDSVWDMKSAQELNVFAVGTVTGFASPKELTHAGANCLISSPTDLITLVNELNKEQSTKKKTAIA